MSTEIGMEITIIVSATELCGGRSSKRETSLRLTAAVDHSNPDVHAQAMSLMLGQAAVEALAPNLTSAMWPPRPETKE